MERVTLRTGGAVPAIGFGTWQLEEGSEARQAVKEALKVGYRLIDTARIYGNETSVGQIVLESSIARDEIFVTTKLWTSDQGYDSALRAFDASLARLGLDYIDLYLIHWPGHDARRRADSWRALTELRQSGKARAIGVSNYDVQHLSELLATSDEIPAVNQIEFHPFVFEQQRPALEYCQRQGIVVEAYSPLARSRVLNHLAIMHIAEQTGMTPAQVLLRWCIQHGTVPIPKSANPGRIRENFEVFDFKLSPKDMDILDGLARRRI